MIFFIRQKEQDALVLFVSMFYALYGFGIIFVICELGQRLTNAYGQIAEEIENFEWYSFSHELQRMLPIILVVAQQPIELECFGGITGIRETLKKVSRALTV